jgi:intein/homing endonuclease
MSTINIRIDENIKNGNNPYAQVLDTTDKEWFIPSVDQDGNTSWKKITQLIRHPLYTGLIKVTTNNGRNVTATTGLSFLTKKEGKLVPTLGSDLNIGDELPIAWRLPRPNTIISEIHLKDYLSPLEYIYGSDLWRAKEIRYRKSKIGKEDILKGYVYNHIRSSAKNLIPDYIPLDEDFGFFIGSYIAAGCSSDNYIAISNYDEKYLKRIEKIMTKWGVKIGSRVGARYRQARYE